MRISLNAKKINGPYGGGNQAANIIEEFLCGQGHEVYRTLVPKLDIIIIMSSQDYLQITSYNILDIKDYLFYNPNTIVIHRINTCDEPRGKNTGINEAILRVNKIADYSIFISSFVKNLFANKGIDVVNKPNSVILNGADRKIFYPDLSRDHEHHQKLRIITHHWSSNFMKGFDVYERLDQLLEVYPFKEYFDFTYVGNVPVGINFRNTRVIPPTFGRDLANILRCHDIYLTAARNEAGGMHHIEGMRCGLPVLYLNSGALPEYCGPYGIEYNLINFEEKLLKMRNEYLVYRKKVLKCPYTNEWMAQQYYKIMCKLFENRQKFPKPVPSLFQKMRYAIFTQKYRKLRKGIELVNKALNQLR